MNEKYYLVIDQGGHATRAIVFDTLGEVVCQHESPITTIAKNEFEVEHDPIEMLESVESCISQTEDTLGESFKRIVKAGLATQRSSMVCWNKKSGEPLTPIISWQDRRTVNALENYRQYESLIHDSTGLYLNPHYGATKMRWCLDNCERVKEALANNELAMAPLASFILASLLENKPYLIDPSNGSRTLLLNFKSIAWDKQLLEIFGIPLKTLPDIAWTKDDYGIIRRKNHAIPLNICIGDQTAAFYGYGEPKSDQIFVNAGTGAFLLKSSPSIPQISETKLLASVAYADAKHTKYVIEGTVNGAGRALQWCAEETGCLDYENQLEDWADKYTSLPVFINGISGVGSPYWISNVKSEFVDLENSGKKTWNTEEKFVAVLESIVFLTCANIKQIELLTYTTKQISLAGGLAKNKAFCQALANLSGVEVCVYQEVEATAKGVFLLLLSTEIKDKQLNSVGFHPEYDSLIQVRFSNWSELMNTLLPKS